MAIIDKVLGVLLIGAYINCSLYAIELVCLYFYFTRHASDQWVTRGSRRLFLGPVLRGMSWLTAVLCVCVRAQHLPQGRHRVYGTQRHGKHDASMRDRLLAGSDQFW